jgi:NAD(P)H-dependent FMN reductase
MVKIAIILGSTRPNRFGPQPAKWLHEQSKNIEGAEFELIDLKDINLPLLDEPSTPSTGEHTKEHTKKWAKIVGEADGFVFVTAEYNHSMPAAIKNAIDFLFAEWHYKPVSFASYGNIGGGVRAVEHLRTVCSEVKMYDLRENLVLPNYWDNQDENGQYKFTDVHVKLAKQILDQTVFWATKLKPIREELARSSKLAS